MDKKQITLPNNETYSYIETGTGTETLLFIHGNMASGLHFLPLIDAMKDTYHILSPDMRGFGDSSYHTPINSIEDLSDDIALFLEAMNQVNVTVFGWSTGGAVALKLAAKYPNLVKKIVLIESASYRGYPIFQKDANNQVIPGVVYESKEALAKDPVNVVPLLMAQATKNKPFIKMIFDALLYNVGTPYKQYDIFLEEALKQRNLVDIDWALTTFNMSSTSNGMTQGDGTIQDVTQPVLSFYGDHDLVVLEYMIDETVAALKNATKVVIKNAGHSPVDTHTKQLLEEITKFL